MNQQTIREEIGQLFQTLPGNKLPWCDTPLMETPIVGFGSASDPLFDEYQKPGIVGPWYWKPEKWLEGAKSVISLFFPISEVIRRSNDAMTDVSSVEWSYARVEGQAYIAQLMEALRSWLETNGVRACVPSADPRFSVMTNGSGIEGFEAAAEGTFSGRWSERHAAYVCGLGTFCLSKGLITEKGVAGRYASVIIDLPLEADAKPYTGIYDYCIRCGACAARCPVNAIDLVQGKDHYKCWKNMEHSRVVLAPRYGCGLCQTNVPCENGIPGLYNTISGR